MKKKISLFIVLILMILLPFNLSASALDEGYYVVGSFNNNTISDEYKMTLNADSNNYEYILNNQAEYTQLRVTDGSNYYRTEGLNKGSSFLLKEKGKYLISFNKEPILDGKNVKIDKLNEPSYYACGTFNNELSDEFKLTMVEYQKYEIKISVSGYSLLYITDGSNEYRNSNGSDYVLDSKGDYLLEFSINDSGHRLNIKRADDNLNYYVLGSFNSFSMNDESKMTKENGLYKFYIDTTNVESFYITDGDCIYKNGKDNYLLNDHESYLISFNKENSSVKIDALEYYVLSEDNDYTENESFKLKKSLDNNDFLEYEIELSVDEGYQFTIGNDSMEYSDNGNSFLIKDGGVYKILFSPSHKYNNSNVSIIKIRDNEINYYVLGGFNSYIMDSDSLMEENGNEYTFRVDTIKPTSFYITDGENTYRNDKVDYLLKGHSSYLIHFNSDTKATSIEELDYYILSEDNSFTEDIDYRLKKSLDNDLFLEYSYSITVNEAYQFIIGNSKYEYNNNGGSFLIKEDGQYTIYFSPSHIYENGTNVRIAKFKEENDKFYLMGSFNDYTIDDEYLLSLNKDNRDYIEYIIDIDLMKGDSFYIHGSGNDYYSPKGSEIVANENASYRIYFSEEYDYGNGYSIYYKIIKNPNIEQRTIIINTADELIDFINQANNDSFSTNLTVEIRRDLDLGGRTISPIMVFSGALNGNFHRIYNFKLDTKLLGSEIGFIRRLLAGAEVRGLELEYDLKIENNDTAVGGIVGISYGRIKNSTFSGHLKGLSLVGGIVGKNTNDAEIINCNSTGSIIGRSFVGGIAGLNNGLIKGSYNDAKINDSIYSSSDERKIINIGGIAGFNTNLIVECFNRGRVGAKKLGGFIGGIAGSQTGIAKDCYNIGTILGKKYVGGVIGYFAELKNNNEDSIYDEIIKEIEDILNPNNSEFAVKPDKKIKGSLSDCYNKGDAFADSSAGGIAGFASSEGLNGVDSYNLKRCYNMGNVSISSSYAGGIVGEHSLGSISECYSTGIIESENGDYIGGICGYSNGEIIASFNMGSIKGGSYVGGISGYIASANNCYSIGSVYLEGSFGGAIGGYAKEINDKIYNNYYVNNGLKAFDNIDYDGKGNLVERGDLASQDILAVDLDFKYYQAADEDKSYPILKSMLNSDSTLKEEFKRDILDTCSFKVEVIFVDDDGSIYEIQKLPYGEGYDMSNLPKPIKRDGYLSKWDLSFNSSCITNDVIVKIIYTEILTSIGMESIDGADVIVEGIFTANTRLSVNLSNDNYLGDNSMYRHIQTYNIDISDSENEIDASRLEVSVRVDNPKGLRVVCIKDDGLVFVDTTISGSYLRFSLNDSRQFMIVQEEFYNINNPEFVRIVSLSAVSTLAGIVIIAGAVVAIKGRKRKNI